MKNLKLSMKEMIMSAILIFGMGGAWMQVQAEINRLTHATKENAKNRAEGDLRNISSLRRMEYRLNKRLDRNYNISKKRMLESN